jgi:hypothetical protein
MINYFSSLKYGATYIFQALPRSMTIWLDYGAKVAAKQGNAATLADLTEQVKK